MKKTPKNTSPAQTPVGKAVAPKKLLAYQPAFIHALRAMLGRRPYDEVAVLVSALERSGVPVRVPPAEGAPEQDRLAYPPDLMQGLGEYLDTTGTHREVRPFLDGLEHGAVTVDAPAPAANP